MEINKVFLTQTFYERYDTVDKFVDMWKASPFKVDGITDEEIKELYFKLLKEYMMSHFKFTEKLQIDLQIGSMIKDYYPNLKKKLDLQKQLTNLTADELEEGGVFIQASMQNPDTDEVNAMSKDLPYTSQKSIQTRRKSKLDRIATQYNLIVDGLYDMFLLRFKGLFVTLIIGTNNLLSMDNEDWNKKEGE